MKKKVLVAMSGGVDSSVSAYLLKERGFLVAGITMDLGIERYGLSLKTIESAKKVCAKLDIPHYTLDFSSELEKKVISRFISEYLNGRTPNPCIECNRYLKFDLLLRHALKMGFDFLATGHYVRIKKIKGKIYLKKAKDPTKDQSYFLYPIKKEYLKFLIFPLGEFKKQKVFDLAQKLNLPILQKESQDICFIQGDYRKFLLQRMPKFGSVKIVDKNGNILGTYRGIPFLTVGQREGLGLNFTEPLYVLWKIALKLSFKKDSPPLLPGNRWFFIKEIFF